MWPMTAPLKDAVPAVFFDRDGTLMEEVNYCGDPREVRLLPGATEALRALRSHGFKTFVITNQSGIGRGYFNEEAYHAVHAELERQLGADLIDATYFCPDFPSESSLRRKPSPAMVLEAQHDHHLDLPRSFFVGDRGLDIACGKAAGTRTILVETGYGLGEKSSAPDWIARDLAHAAEIILHADD